MSGGTYESTLGGTWGTYGIGANWSFAPGKFLHARFLHSEGQLLSEPSSVYLGTSFEM